MDNRSREELTVWFYRKVLHLEVEAKIKGCKLEIRAKDRSQYFMDQDYRIKDNLIIDDDHHSPYPDPIQYLFRADPETLAELREYYLSLRLFDPKDWYGPEMQELRDNGHTVVSIRPCLYDNLFASFECEAKGIRYWAHFDDGDVRFTRSDERPFGHPDIDSLGVLTWKNDHVHMIPRVAEIIPQLIDTK